MNGTRPKLVSQFSLLKKKKKRVEKYSERAQGKSPRSPLFVGSDGFLLLVQAVSQPAGNKNFNLSFGFCSPPIYKRTKVWNKW